MRIWCPKGVLIVILEDVDVNVGVDVDKESNR